MSIQHLFTKTVGSTHVVFRNTVSLNFVEKIIFFKETNLGGNWLSKQYKYSWDNTVWTCWNTLTQQALSEIDFTNRPNFWLEIRYTRENYLSANINDWYLFYEGLVVDDDPSILIDADLLNGEPGTYYLNSGNHYGPTPNIHIENLPLQDTSVGGFYDHRYDGSLFSTFYFKSIGGKGGISVTDASDISGNNMLMISVNASIGSGENVGDGDASILFQNVNGPSGSTTLKFRELKSGIGMKVSVSENVVVIDSSGGGNYNTALDSSIAMYSSVGGISSGTTAGDLYGTPMIHLWDNLLFPTVNPTFVNPLNSFSDNKGPLEIIGDPINITFISEFDKGSIYLGSVFQDYRSGNSSNYKYTDPSSNTLLVDISTAALSNTQTINGYIITIGYQDWTSQVDYLEGPQPYDSKGNLYDSSLSAGSTSINSLRIEGVHVIKASSVDITIDTSQALISMLTGNDIEISLVTETDGNKQSFMIPSQWETSPTNRPLIGVQTYNTISGSWEYQGGSITESLTFWDRSLSSNPVYYEYIYNSDNRAATQIRLKF